MRPRMTILLEMGQCSQSRICGGASDEYAKLSDDGTKKCLVFGAVFVRVMVVL